MDDLVDVLAAPSTVFARREKAGFGGALVIVWIALSALFMIARPIMRPIMEAEMEKAQAKMAQANPNLTEEQRATAQTAAQKFGGVIATVGGIVGPPIAILILGLFVWLVGRIFGGQINAGQGVLIATYAYVPRIIGSILLVIQGFVLDVNKITSLAQVSIGPSRFFDPATTGAQLLMILTRFDVFVIWSTVLIAIAYHVMGKMSKGTAYGAAIVLWALGAVPTLLGALRG
jgi:hypothetical protein